MYSKILIISTFAVLGLWLRIFLGNEYEPSPPFFEVLVANTLGCFLVALSFGLRSRKLLSDTPFLGIATGFCGSLTSWSSWNQDMSVMLLNGDVLDAIGGYFIGFALPLLTLTIGSDTADLIATVVQGVSSRHRTSASVWLSDVAWSVVCTVACLVFIVGAALGIWYDDDNSHRSWYVATLLAPFGAVSRFLLSKRFNQPLLVKPRQLSHLMARHTNDAQARAAIELSPRDSESVGTSRPSSSGTLSEVVPPSQVPSSEFVSEPPVVIPVPPQQRRHHLRKWIPFRGTFVANITASVIVSICYLIIQASPSDWSFILGNGVIFGLTGCLSTVSTLFMELTVLHDVEEVSYEYRYMLSTVLTSLTLSSICNSVALYK